MSPLHISSHIRLDAFNRSQDGCFADRVPFLMAVKYFENNRAGITVYGFTLDRSTLHTIFGIELSLVLWLLGKTVGIS